MLPLSQRITLKMLRYFYQVAQCQQFSQAAEQLNITKSPLSAQIKELEQALGVVLFERDTRNVRLTPRANSSIKSVSVFLTCWKPRSIAWRKVRAKSRRP
ncbi:helix-turn-helix domain-containing protein [Vibrio furnissii]|uniref:helix-turn-helix domain-containing protein n=1 Tax=Vibrio furnissii TaxID=29494 RepID=UPI001F559D34|nr:LysR family transcriptional regulator [Vibrio furnissii]